MFAEGLQQYRDLLEPGASVLLFLSGEPQGDEVRARIFEPFYSNRPGGTGLGLAIASNVARAHGGDLALTRNEPGHVCFTLRLPGALTEQQGERHGAYSHR